MRCEDVIELFQQRLDEPRETLMPQSVTRHLGECAQCAAACAELEQVHEQLRLAGGVCGEMVSAGFHERFMSKLRLEERHADAGVLGGFYRQAFAAICGMAAVLLCAFLLPRMIESGAGQKVALQGSGQSQPVVKSGGPVSPARPTQVELAAASTLASLGSALNNASIPTPERVYADAAPNMAEFTETLYVATTTLADSLRVPGTAGE